MPKEERKALIIAMSLHEKGKAALKKGNLQLAIVLLLEAKDEYNQCRSEILKAVDNYGEIIFLIFQVYLAFIYTDLALGWSFETYSAFALTFGLENLLKIRISTLGHTCAVKLVWPWVRYGIIPVKTKNVSIYA